MNKYEVAVLDAAGLPVWACGWYQGETSWNNDAPALDAATPMDAAWAGAEQALAGARIAFRNGLAKVAVDVRPRDAAGFAPPASKFTASFTASVTSVEVRQ